MTPTMELPSSGIHALTVIVYRPEILWRLLAGWAEYEATHRPPRKPFAEGGSISRRVIATEGSFVVGAVDYACLKEARREIQPYTVQLATATYWEDGLRSVKRVGLAMERDENRVREWVWEGTEYLIMRLCGLPPRDAHAEARLFRERLHSRHL